MYDCAQHEIRGLTEAIKLEKRKRKHGKKLNLLGEEDEGPQLFSPAQIAVLMPFLSRKRSLGGSDQKRHQRATQSQQLVIQLQNRALSQATGKAECSSGTLITVNSQGLGGISTNGVQKTNSRGRTIHLPQPFNV
jgi:hypothetical protein